MRIRKVINNNIVWASDDAGQEVIVLGNGVGFQKKKGEILDKKRAEKVFHLSDKNLSQFEQLVSTIPLSSIRTSEKVIACAKSELKTELNDNIYISLTDHLNYAVERKRQGIEFENALLWEIRKYYPKEFAIGKKAVEIVKKELGVQLSDDEAGFFALHIVNAELQTDSSYGMEMPEIIKDILNLVKFSIGKDFEEDDLSYERFITHLKFFLQRVISHKVYTDEESTWAAGLKEAYPLAHKTALRIKSYIKAKLSYEISEEEITYLTLHIQRIIGRQ